MPQDEYIPKIALSIHAHPDDQEFTVAGLLARWAHLNCQVISVIVTSGESGSNDPSRNADYKPNLALLRESEQNAACSVCTKLFFYTIQMENWNQPSTSAGA